MAAVTIAGFGLQNGTERTVYVIWKWDKSHTKEYRVFWGYVAGGVAFIGSDSTTTYKQSTYTAPGNATKVFVQILAKSSTYTKNGKDVSYWTADWSTKKDYAFKNVVVKTVPTIKATSDITIAQQAGTNRTMYAKWAWTQSNTKEYEVAWDYTTAGSGIWFEGTTETVTYRDCVYSAPSNASWIRFRVRPKATTHTVSGQEVAYWNAAWSAWVTFDMSKLTPAVPSVNPVADVTIGLQKGTSRTLYAKWTWSQSNTDEYEYVWRWTAGDRKNESQYVYYDGASGSTDQLNSTFDVPSNAIKLYFQVRPKAKTRTVSGQEVEYWRTGWSDAVFFFMSSLDPAIPSVDAISTLAIKHQAGTDRTMYATWGWNRDNTEEYEVAWDYTTAGSGIWFEGTTETVKYKNATYSAPSNASQIRCRVCPVAKNHTVNGQEAAYWTTNWSAWVIFDMSDLEPIIPSVESISTIVIGQQNGTDRTMYAKWAWSQSNTKEYNLEWRYATSDDLWFDGGNGTATLETATYSAPNNATSIAVRIKPIADTYAGETGADVEYWSTEWSEWAFFNMSDLDPSTPSVPTVSIEGYNLIAEVDVYNNTATEIEFYVVKNDITKFASGKAPIIKNHASYTCAISAGNQYKVCCRGVKDNEVSEWSEYSANVGTIPATPEQFTSVTATSATSVALEWSAVSNADSYTIEYTTQKRYFDSSPENVKSATISSTVTRAEITGLDSGETWYFRLKATNSQGDSGWNCSGYSITIGEAPSAPTTWSLTATAMVGEIVNFYWVHNSQDNSSESFAELELTINGVSTIETIKNSADETDAGQTSVYSFDTSTYPEGTIIEWRVRTRGVMPDYGEWSIRRVVTVYAPPVLEFANSDPISDTLSRFPIVISLLAGPSSQNALRYSISILANETYSSTNYDGSNKWVNKGDSVYSAIFDTNDDPNSLHIEISASDVNLDNNISYTLICGVTMDSGLTASCSLDFRVEWESSLMEPNAEMSFDDSDLVAYITPYCEDTDGNRIEEVILSVYRRNFDGTFTEIASGLSGGANTTVTDPHPSLDYARYRIIAISTETGELAYYDMPGYPVNEPAVIIQWDEEWFAFDIDDENVMSEPAWAGSMLKLPYNIDVSNDHSPDVALVEYIGRKHPVSYYGTQKGEKATWNMDVPKDDKETLYALRRLAIYSGDIYVREPSGSGYWAQVTVSFSQKHMELVIPVTLNITRVEGGA